MLVPAAGIDSHLMTNGGGCPTAFADGLVPAAGIDSHLMTNGRGGPTALANALVPVAECILARFGPRFLRNFRALGSAHYYSITCIVTSCNNTTNRTDKYRSIVFMSLVSS